MALTPLFLALANATLSSAAVGEFEYSALNLNNTEIRDTLIDPDSGEFIALPALLNTPAFRARNRTTSTATLYQTADCEGDTWELRPLIGRSPLLARFRAVVFHY
ncbi:hypothetical protein OG401_39255 [Kitasatospora purpeofusca]|uniref:hypothetical protein n=1 Tax=Kitasatospora purpeofusca TaxID=67352 RepID=UPI0022532970|nr:hypothetical protein [Kitasatospora purpeofusca]MCX4690262.1 hypothetical protein [Kitasatospora purpeofusca]